MKVTKTLFLGFIFSIGIAQAQTDFRPGYVVRSDKDTLFGEIDYRDNQLMSERCRFRVSRKDAEKLFYPDDILEYRFTDSKYFVSREINGTKVFLEFLLKGKISVYFLRNKAGDHYYIEKEGAGLVEIPYSEEIKTINGTSYFYTSTKHIGILNYYMFDAPALQTKIAEFGRPDHDNLIKLAEDYHNAMCNDTKCIIYEKKMPPLKVGVEVVGGIIQFLNTDLKENAFFQKGILAHIWLPRTSEKFYFRTGVLHTYNNTPNSHVNFYKIPVQFEYIYPTGVIRPKAALGMNFFIPLYSSVGLMGGFDIKLHKSVHLSVNYDIDFDTGDKIMFIPKGMLAQSLLAGLVIIL